MARVASFHVVREESAIRAMAHLAADRRQLARTPGLCFWRLLGTGRDRSTTFSVDPHRTAFFATWRDERDVDAFLRLSPVAARWAAACEHWHVRLRLLSGYGSWGGIDVLTGLAPGERNGAVAVVTRAAVRRRAWRAFAHAGRQVDVELQRAPGLLGVLGMGELPIARLGTFSLWRSVGDITAFATGPQHLATVRRTRAEGWYREDLFARFQPYASSGTWAGRDPLAP